MIIALADKIIRKINKIGGKNKEPKARFSNIYEHLYQTYAESASPLTSVGAGDFNLIGQIEKAILELEGLRSDSTLVDFGCGVGRLALQVIPELTFGKYLGLDISTTMPACAKASRKTICGAEPMELTPIFLPLKSVSRLNPGLAIKICSGRSNQPITPLTGRPWKIGRAHV